VRTRGERGFVRRHHQARAVRAVELEHQSEHAIGRFAVEVPRRLVGEHARRLSHERARERRPLTLSSGKLSGSVI